MGKKKKLKKLKINTLLQERGVRYGKFINHAAVTQNIKLIISDAMGGSYFTPSQRESLDMIAHKIGRIVCGDPNYIDSWDDIAGYATLISSELQGDEK